jgi:hypothetical protein
MVWYEYDWKRTRFSVFILSQRLAGCTISLSVEAWAHRTGLTLSLVLCIEVSVSYIEVIGDVY